LIFIYLDPEELVQNLMKKFLVVIFLLVFIQFSYGQKKIAINYITDVQVSLDPNSKLLLGIEFNTSEDGYVSKIRLLNRNNEWGDHFVKILERSNNQTSVLAGPFIWYFSTQIQGWIEYDFPSPIPVFKDKTYILSITKSIDAKNSGPELSGSLESNPNTRYSEKSNAENSGNNLLYNRLSSDYVLIVAYPKLIAGIIGQSQTIDYNTQPDALKQLIPPTGGTGTYIYKWQSSLDGINWTTINGANLISYSPPALTGNTWYRLIATSGNFGSVASNSVLIKVNPKLIAGTIGQNQTICYNSKPAALNQISLPSGGTGTYVYQWQDSWDGNTWTDISGANLVSYSPPVLNVNTWYRLNISSIYTVSSNSVLITVLPRLISGTMGYDQTICFGSEPVMLNQISHPSGGTGDYIYQWQSSLNNNNWTDINGANLASYSPPALTTDTWYRQNVTSGCTLSSNSVKITVHSQISLNPLNQNITIDNNTSATFHFSISGGTSPYTIEYTLNGIMQPSKRNYNSGDDISTGILTTGVYSYVLTSVTDANGCVVQRPGISITVTVLSGQVTLTNKALIIVNSSSASYSDYVNYIKPYLDNFGIPYNVCNIRTDALPSFDDFAVIIVGHKNVYSSGYPIAQIETAVRNGVGLYSFDPHLFDYSSGFNSVISQQSVNSNRIDISNTTHFITQYHVPDTYNPTNNVVDLARYWSLIQSSNLVGGVNLATMSSGSNTIPLLQISRYGNGRIVKWCGYDWVFESTLGPVYGMDDLIWRGIVWAARKPFVMQGMPPFITMRVDDSDGQGGGVIENFEWIKISNEFGIIPWCGTFNNGIPPSYIPTLRGLINSNHATASPHAFGDGFIYFNHEKLPSFDAAANTRIARDFYIQNGLKISKYFVPHYYEVSSEALPIIYAMGGEFLGIHMLPDNFYYYPTPWINCGPYRINRNGMSDSRLPVYYGGYVQLNGINFFNCVTEIRDDGGYEWYPDNNVATTVARGIRHLRRSLNSMVLACLFTHEQFFVPINSTNWREILRQITSAISGYNPEYKSMDYAASYIRAKTNIKIINITAGPNNIEISYVGYNDLDTKCYLFTEQNDQINFRFVMLPQINGNNTVTVPK
jgi:hypothetical protein